MGLSAREGTKKETAFYQQRADTWRSLDKLDHKRTTKGRKMTRNGEKKFRFLLRTKPTHPAVMVEDNGKTGVGYNITHTPKKSFDSSWHRLHKNPDPNDSRPSYLVHKRYEGKIGGKAATFSKAEIKGYRLDRRDSREIDLIEKAKKQGKPWNEYLPKYKKKNRKRRRKKFIGLF